MPPGSLPTKPTLTRTLGSLCPSVSTDTQLSRGFVPLPCTEAMFLRGYVLHPVSALAAFTHSTFFPCPRALTDPHFSREVAAVPHRSPNPWVLYSPEF